MLVFKHDKFSRYCKRIMRSRGISYRYLSQSTNITLSLLHSIIQDPSEARINHVFAIAHKLNLNIYKFIDDEEYQKELPL